MSSMSKVRTKSFFWSEMSQRILERLPLNFAVSEHRSKNGAAFAMRTPIGTFLTTKTCPTSSSLTSSEVALMPIEKKTWTLENWAQVSRYESQARDQVRFHTANWIDCFHQTSQFSTLTVLLHYKSYLLKVSLCWHVIHTVFSLSETSSSPVLYMNWNRKCC